jgi:AP-1-like transcription factor
LEDKVADLEAKNEQAISENENLRDLLSRLQTENVSLKQSSFTFSVPKSASGSSPESAQASTSFASQSPVFASTSRTSATSPRTSPNLSNPLEWSSLTTFDPAVLNLLDDSPQQTATDGAMQMDFGFGSNTGLSANTPYTTIASNPMFMSFASTFDTDSPSISTADHNNFSNFDLSGLTSWPTPPSSTQDASLDDLLAGYMSRGPVDFNFLPPSSIASESPVAHFANHINTNAASQSPSFSSTSSPSSSVSDPLFDSHRDSSSSESDVGHEGNFEKSCPKTKGELAKRIEESGPSPFAPKIRKSSDAMLGSMIMCEGTMFPKTQLSDKNVEVLKAWRSITSNPKFKVRLLWGYQDMILTFYLRILMLMNSAPNSLTRQDVTGQRWFWNRNVLIISSKIYHR